jgi:hypothetical protein
MLELNQMKSVRGLKLSSNNLQEQSERIKHSEVKGVNRVLNFLVCIWMAGHMSVCLSV